LVDKFPSRERAAALALAPRVSAVVVVRGVKAGQSAPLDLCLRSALAEPWIDDLVIVDHGNAPEVSGALRALQADRRDIKLLTAAENATTAAAANHGAQYALGRWLLFLDPGVVLQRGAVARMAAAGGGARTPWIVGGRLTDTEGRERIAARGGALNTWSSIAVAMGWAAKPLRARRKTADADDAPEAAAVAAVSGAFMLIPRSDFQQLGGFDEGFHTDAADLDLCRRAADAGGSVLFQPDAAGVQFERVQPSGRKRAQGLARFAAKSAKTPAQKLFASFAGPALSVLMALKDFVAGRQPVRR
jgi:N-acetylglucosaminyl-diphospho-decaprenol L-rhamnosyltransferase